VILESAADEMFGIVEKRHCCVTGLGYLEALTAVLLTPHSCSRPEPSEVWLPQ